MEEAPTAEDLRDAAPASTTSSHPAWTPTCPASTDTTHSTGAITDQSTILTLLMEETDLATPTTWSTCTAPWRAT